MSAGETRAGHILVVEDDPDFAEGLADVLGLAGYEVLTAVSGEEALEVFPGAGVDLTILDMKLPGMDGVEVLRAIRATALGMCRCNPPMKCMNRSLSDPSAFEKMFSPVFWSITE